MSYSNDWISVTDNHWKHIFQSRGITIDTLDDLQREMTKEFIGDFTFRVINNRLYYKDRSFRDILKEAISEQ